MNKVKSGVTINLGEAFTYFFKLPDWWKRLFLVFAVWSLEVILLVTIFFATFIPVIGGFLALGIFLLMIVIGMLYTLYYRGYLLEISAAVKSDGNISEVKPLGNFLNRLKVGIKFSIRDFLYKIPYLVTMTLGLILFYAAIIVWGLDGTGERESMGWLLLILSTVVWLVSSFFSFVYTNIFNPFVYYSILRKTSGLSALSPKRFWSFFSKNWLNLLVFAGINLGINFVWGLFGFILIPFAFAWDAFWNHFLAHYFGQLSKIE